MSALRVNSGTVPRTQRLRLRGRFPRTRQRAALLSERRGDHGRDRSVRREGAGQLRLLSQALRRRLAEAGGTSQTYRGRWPQTCKYLTGIRSKFNKSLIAGCYAWPNRGNPPKPPREYGNPSISTRRVSAWRAILPRITPSLNRPFRWVTRVVRPGACRPEMSCVGPPGAFSSSII